MTRAICFAFAAASWMLLPCSVNEIAAQDALEAKPPRTQQDQLGPDSRPQSFQPLIDCVATALGISLKPKEPEVPAWFPLESEHQAWVDQVLAYWEKRCEKVKSLELTFQRWEYDPLVIPGRVQQLRAQGELSELPFTTYSSGVIKYAAPDRLLLRTERLRVINVANPTAAPSYEARPKEDGVHWVTDGKTVFTFQPAPSRRVIESELPPDSQSKLLFAALLWNPFASELSLLYDVHAETVKDRYWIRPVLGESKGEYCLEFWPKRRPESARFMSLQVVLDGTDFLPAKMVVYSTDWTTNNPHRTTYQFNKRVVNNPNVDLREFSDVKTPLGWTRISRDADGNIK